MFDNFFISEEYSDYFSVEEINAINEAFETKEPLIITGGIGDIEVSQIIIDVGIGVISAIAYDALKLLVIKLKKAVKKKHQEKEPLDPGPDINIRVDAEDANIAFTVKFNCMESDEDTEKGVNEMKKIAETIIINNSTVVFDTNVF